MYVPVLKARAAEFTAVTTRQAGSDLLPLFEVVPDKNRGLGAEMLFALEQLGQAWAAPHFLDVHNLAPDSAGRALAWELARVWLARRGRGQATPCVESGDSPEVLAAVAPVAQQAGALAVRVDAAAARAATLPAQLGGTLGAVGLDRPRVTLILDWYDAPTTVALDVIEAHTRGILRAAGAGWKHVIVAGTSAGSNPSATGAAIPRPRREWWLWLRLHHRPEPAVPAVTFADYAGFPAPKPSNGIAKIATIRYTGRDALHIWRERTDKATKITGLELCARQIVMSPEFRGAAFSTGDATIANAANGLPSNNNPTGWRVTALQHHLEVVLHDIPQPPPAPAAGTI